MFSSLRGGVILSSLALGLVGVFGAPAKAQLVASYRFSNTLAADQGGVQALTAVGAGSFVPNTTVFGQSRTVYQRTGNQSAQSALRLDTTPLALTANNYSVELVFNFNGGFQANGYRRIVNSGDPASFVDNGFYDGPSNQLSLYSNGNVPGGATLSVGTYYDVLLTVSASAETAYLNGTPSVSIAATPDAIATHYLTFFQDDATEYDTGNVALIRVFNRTLTSAEAASLYNNGNPFAGAAAPEPGALALIVPGLTLGVCRLARRRARL